jgi:N-hydroxyarylamine O-acetyltransferase
MNGLFARVLRTIGFEVDLVSGAVGRDKRGDAAVGTHLVLIARLDRPYIVDVGFGDGFLEPLPLAEGRYAQGTFQFAVSQDRGRWVAHNHEHRGAASFDFTLTARHLTDFAVKCRELQTSPESSFVQRTVCQRFVPDGIEVLRGRGPAYDHGLGGRRSGHRVCR